MKIDNKQFIWVEKYRPQSVDDLIITDEIRAQLKNWIENDKQIPNLGFFSINPGTGKSSLSRSILNDLDADFLFINASKDTGIDMIRNKIAEFASAVSFMDSPKVVVLDEFDGASNSAQEALRAFIEEFSKNCRFILTGNYMDKILYPILDRLIKFDFDTIYNKNQKELLKQIYQRCCYILEAENVTYNKEELKPMIVNLYPSVREIVMLLQESTKIVDGKKVLKLDSANIEANKIYSDLVESIRTKNVKNFQPLVKEIKNYEAFFKHLYKNIEHIFEEKSIGQVIIMIHAFMSSNVLSRDGEITLLAFCFQLSRTQDIQYKSK